MPYPNKKETVDCLQKIFQRYGTGILSNMNRIKSFVIEYYQGNNRSEAIISLRTILDSGVMVQMANLSQEKVADAYNKCENVLTSQYGYSKQEAEDVLDMLCEVFHYSKPARKSQFVQVSNTGMNHSTQNVRQGRPVDNSNTYNSRQISKNNNLYGLNLSNHTTWYDLHKQTIGKCIGVVVGLVALVVLLVFWVYPKLIYPNLANSDLYTPEIIKSYYYTPQNKYDTRNVILTIQDCSDNGEIVATWEEFKGNSYYKINMKGTIVQKKNNGNVVIEWTSQSPEIIPDGEKWNPEETAKISNQCSVLKTDYYKLGTEVNEEFMISSIEDFKKLEDSDAVFCMKNDIDFEGENWEPIKNFTGVLYGNGYTIKNLQIDSSSTNVGLFATIDGAVHDLKIEDANIHVSGRNENVGILCGQLRGMIRRVTVSGSVTAEKSTNVGGVAGYVYLNDSYVFDTVDNHANVNGLSNVGGVFGSIKDYVENGVVHYELTLTNINNYGSVCAIEDYAGGITSWIKAEATGFGGKFTTTIRDCTNKGTITGRYFVGGIVGDAYGYSTGLEPNTSRIDNCVNSSEIYAQAVVGCIAGNTYKYKLTNCNNEGSKLYASGTYIEEGQRTAYVGGLVGCGFCEENCTNYIDINYTQGGIYVGGLMGYCDYIGTFAMKNLLNKGNIHGDSYVGGIVGMMNNFIDNGVSDYMVTMELFNNEGQISGNGDYIGGHAGFVIGNATGVTGNVSWTIYDGQNSGNISGNANVGGLFGGFDASDKEEDGFKMYDCSSTGQVTANTTYGEIIGLDKT